MVRKQSTRKFLTEHAPSDKQLGDLRCPVADLPAKDITEALLKR
jgi:hypothetical protein